MMQEQEPVGPAASQGERLQRASQLHLFFGLLPGVGIALALIIVEMGILLLLNPFHIVVNTNNRLAAMLTFFAHTPLLWFILLLEVAVILLIVYGLARPLALAGYLRTVHTEQEEYYRLYTPLKVLTTLQQSTSYSQIAPEQEEPISILDLIQQQSTHQLILGVPGSGKTTALRAYQYEISYRAPGHIFAHEPIPLLIPLKNYSLFLKARPHLIEDNTAHTGDRGTLLAFLYECDLPGMKRLRPYLRRLVDRGQLVLLCDGLNEVDSNYLSYVCDELVWWMQNTQNRFVVTCREVDYHEQPVFVQLVETGQMACAVVYPLQPEQMSDFVERYIESQSGVWKHTAGQIMQVIDRSRLRYHCTNPMMLFTLMGIIDTVGVERGKEIDTRGLLLRESVLQLLRYERQRPAWSANAPEEQEVIRFLGELACAARWANDRNAIQLRISRAVHEAKAAQRREHFDELADELCYWLDEHPAKGPFAEDMPYTPYEDLPTLLQFALSTALIEVSPLGVVSFRHELLAEYFVAEYFLAVDQQKRATAPRLREELLAHVGRWSEPVAIWAGLLDDPLVLAERFGALGRRSPAYVLQALTLGLICVGVLWAPTQSPAQRLILLPPSLEDALAIAVRNKVAREELARIFTRCAEEGGQEVYHSLLPLIMVEGVDELLLLLDQKTVAEMLFTQLQEVIDNVAYEAQVKRLTRVLGRLGGGYVVEQAAQLSVSAAGRSLRLRAAAVNILGGTRDPQVVDVLMARLRDADHFITERATNALIRLGPDLALPRVIQELESHKQGAFMQRVHSAALLILRRFLEEREARQLVSHTQYQRALEAIVPVLTSDYQSEPDNQQLACSILVAQARAVEETDVLEKRQERVIETLLFYLPSQDEVAARNVVRVLQEIGSPAIPYLIEALKQPSERARLRVLEVAKVVRDPLVLPPLLQMMSDTSPAIQKQLGPILVLYAPESIFGLIDLVYTAENESVAERAANVLSDIGASAVLPIMNVLFKLVPNRTRLLVNVLEHIHDEQCVPTLVTLLQSAQNDVLLTIAIVRALGRFSERRVVAPLLTLLASSHPQVYEEAVDALSQVGPVALDDLVTALGEQQDPGVLGRIQRVLLAMKPFPGEQLIEALRHCNEVQARQIVQVFKVHGVDAAMILVMHLLHPDEAVRGYIQRTLSDMPGSVVVPALLEALHEPALRNIACKFLIKYPDAAIPPLVELLGEQERGEVVALILPLFGLQILRFLVSGLNDPRSQARALSQRVIVSLVTQSQKQQEVLHEIVHLFALPLPGRARDTLLRVITNELAESSLPILLHGLEDAHLIDHVADALVLLARKDAFHDVVMQRLLQSLATDERRRGAKVALVRIAAPAVFPVSKLITDPRPVVALAARDVLREIGVPALDFIWQALRDTSNLSQREAALEVFHSMPTEIVKDELIAWLLGDELDEITMAVGLMFERIRDEAVRAYADQEMIPILIEHVQDHGLAGTHLRVIALLFLVGEHVVMKHLVRMLDDGLEYRKQLTYLFLLFSKEAQSALLDVLTDTNISPSSRADVAAVLGMMGDHAPVVDYAQNLSRYGISAKAMDRVPLEQLTIALQALGGLLAGGIWNTEKLQEMRAASKEGSPSYELFSVLLGMRYEPRIAELRNELRVEREKHQQELKMLTARIVADNQHIQELDIELEAMRREHDLRGDELQHALQDNDVLRRKLEQVLQDKQIAHSTTEQLAQERDLLRVSLEQVIQERTVLNARLEQALQEKQLLSEQREQLLQQLQPDTQ